MNWADSHFSYGCAVSPAGLPTAPAGESLLRWVGHGPLSQTNCPEGEAKNRLSGYVTDVERTHDRVLITRHGHPAAVLISPEDLAALEETVDILTTAGAREAIAEGLDDLAAGRIADNDALRARLASR